MNSTDGHFGFLFFGWPKLTVISAFLFSDGLIQALIQAFTYPYVLSPNIMEPMRTIVLPSSMAIG